MRKFCVFIIYALCVGAAFAAGENVPTSKSYIDSSLSQKQDTIERTTGANQALTNTGTAGEYGTKDIYDSTGSYAEQTDALVDAATMNAAVQNAINAEFVCISWVDDDPTKDCLLMEIRSVTDKPSGKNLLDPSFMDNSTYKTLTVNGHNVERAKILPTENGKTYTLSATLTWGAAYFYYYLFEIFPDGDMNAYATSPCPYMWNNNSTPTPQGARKATCTFTTKENAVYGVFFANSPSLSALTLSNYQMEEGAVATEYEPYKNLYLPSGN